MDKYERNVYTNCKKRLRKDTRAVCTTNPARWRLGSRLSLGATSQLLQFSRGHTSPFYQLCIGFDQVFSLNQHRVFIKVTGKSGFSTVHEPHLTLFGTNSTAMVRRPKSDIKTSRTHAIKNSSVFIDFILKSLLFYLFVKWQKKRMPRVPIAPLLLPFWIRSW